MAQQELKHTILHYRSSGNTEPQAAKLMHGEIALNYKEGNEKIFLKNTANKIISISSDAYNAAQISGISDRVSGIESNISKFATKAELSGYTTDDEFTTLSNTVAGKAPLTHNHKASEITGGTLDLARIPTGTDNNTVALGGHIHNNYYDANLTRTKKTFLAAPSNANGNATFREIVASDLPTGSTTNYGITKLYDGIDNDSTTVAATAHSVKQAYATLTSALNNKESKRTVITLDLKFLAPNVIGLDDSKKSATLTITNASMQAALGTTTINDFVTAVVNDSADIKFINYILPDSSTRLSFTQKPVIYQLQVPTQGLIAYTLNTSAIIGGGDTPVFTQITLIFYTSNGAWLDGMTTLYVSVSENFANHQHENYVENIFVGNETTINAHTQATSPFIKIIGDGGIKNKLCLNGYGNITVTSTSSGMINISGDTSSFAPSSHTHSASAITGGTLDLARIPTGTDNNTVALGGHTHSTYATKTDLNGKSDTGHQHSASAITGGTLDLARIPTGTNNNTVALGGHTHSTYATKTDLNGKSDTGHTHSASAITGGTLDLARIPTGTNNNTVALGGHTHSYAGSSSVGGSATSAVKLDTATAGSATKPCYFANGKPSGCTYSLEASVPSDAVFTDTNVNATSSTGTFYLLGHTSSAATTTSAVKSSSVYVYDGTKLCASGGLFQESDETLKDFHGEIPVDFEKLKEIPKEYYTWKYNENKEMIIGTSAQKLQKVYPELVLMNPETGKLSVDYPKLSVVALKAVDKLYDENQMLKLRLERLEKILGI